MVMDLVDYISRGQWFWSSGNLFLDLSCSCSEGNIWTLAAYVARAVHWLTRLCVYVFESRLLIQRVLVLVCWSAGNALQEGWVCSGHERCIVWVSSYLRCLCVTTMVGMVGWGSGPMLGPLEKCLRDVLGGVWIFTCPMALF